MNDGIKSMSDSPMPGVEFGRQCALIVEDLNRVQGVLDDAVAGLTADFSRIGEICSDVGGALPDGRDNRSLAQEIERRAHGAVVGVQFHDRVVQMLANISQRVQALGRASEPGAPAAGVEALAEAADLHTRRPVRGGGEGDVELF
ncbi:MAG: hypothetical protein ABL878_18030 [Burkholderiales bacterium]